MALRPAPNSRIVLSGRYDEATAATIGLLVQAHDATARLVAHALAAYDRIDTLAPVDAMLVETLRHDPPVRIMRRVCAAPYGGHPAGALTLGAGWRPCPGHDHALAIAAGAVAAVRA